MVAYGTKMWRYEIYTWIFNSLRILIRNINWIHYRGSSWDITVFKIHAWKLDSIFFWLSARNQQSPCIHRHISGSPLPFSLARLSARGIVIEKFRRQTWERFEFNHRVNINYRDLCRVYFCSRRISRMKTAFHVYLTSILYYIFDLHNRVMILQPCWRHRVSARPRSQKADWYKKQFP